MSVRPAASKVRIWLAPIVIGGLALAGCGDDDQPTEASPTTAQPTVTTTEEDEGEDEASTPLSFDGGGEPDGYEAVIAPTDSNHPQLPQPSGSPSEPASQGGFSNGYYELAFDDGQTLVERRADDERLSSASCSVRVGDSGAEVLLTFSTKAAPAVAGVDDAGEPIVEVPYLDVGISANEDGDVRVVVSTFSDADNPFRSDRDFEYVRRGDPEVNEIMGAYGDGDVTVWLDGSGAVFDLILEVPRSDHLARFSGYVACDPLT
jgi:hypothetical protein